MKKQTNKKVIITVFALIIIGSGIFLAFWGGFFASKPQTFTPHYITYQGTESRIYAVSQTTSYSYVEKEYTASNGQKIDEGNGVFTINLTLRNDYSSDNPPPNNGTPVTPIDGTVYIRLKATLFNNNQQVSTINISPSDFATTADQSGRVLASGQTLNVQLLLATEQTNITSYIVTLESVMDSLTN